MPMQRIPILLLIAMAAGSAVSARAGEPALDPEDERRAFVVADGFEITLFASDPQMAKPTNMNFDPQGRLWVASSETYPQVKPGEVPNDKILILEDTHGTGKADKVTVFADHLLIPTGVLPGDGGAYVADSTRLLHFKDPGPDGRAQLKRVVLDGFGTEDTHHIIHTFRWGMDGRFFFNQSIYIHSHVETPYGVKRLNGGGTWRFDPRTLELEIFTKGLVNHWGHCFTKWGESLATDGAGGEGVNFFFHGATFTASPGAQRILKGMTPGSPKYASAELISSRHFPDDWQGDLVTNDFRASRIVRFKLTEEGSGFTAKLMPDVITFKPQAQTGGPNSADRVFRPVDVKMGPDGALYIADWYNPIINHGEVDFRDPRRDHTHGRIWRLAAKGRPLVEKPQLAGAAVPQLLKELRAPEAYTRFQARRVLIEKGADEVSAALATWIAALDPKDAQFEHDRLEGLWLYQALNKPEPALLKTLLASPEPHVRAAATRVLRDWHALLPDASEWLTKLVQDESPRVRLEAITALENIPAQRSLEIALRALDKPVDANIDFALYHAANTLKDLWQPGIENGSYTFGGNLHSLSFALQAAGSRAGVSPLLKLLKENKIAPENQENVLGLVAGLGSADDLKEIQKLEQASADAGFKVQALKALEHAAKERHLKPAGDLAEVQKDIQGSDPALAAVALRLAGAWKLEDLRPLIEAILQDANKPEVVKIAALDALTTLGGKKSIGTLTATAKGKDSTPVRAAAVAGLAGLSSPAANEPAVALLSGPLDAASVERILSAFTKKEGAGAALANALVGKIAPANAEAGLRFFNASGQNQPELAALLKAAVVHTPETAGSPNLPGKRPVDLATAMNADEKKNLNPDEMKALIADIQTHGDAARGERIFRSKTLSCFSCHAIGGAGGQVGPDLSNVGAASQVDYLIDSVLSPNKSVKEGFNAFAVLTKDHEVFTGVFVRQTATHLILRDGVTDEIPIPLGSIAKKRETGSLMPNGLVDGLSRGEFADLIRFLSELGKPGAFSTAQSQAVRKLLLATETGAFPVYAQASGEIAISEIAFAAKNGTVTASFELDVSTPGTIKLSVNSPKGLTLSNGGMPVELAGGRAVVTTGRNKFSLSVNLAQRGDVPLKIEVDEAPGSPAHFQRVGGK